MTEINPFGADSALHAELRARELREHNDDLTMPWPLERLYEAAREIRDDRDQLPDGSWPLIAVRVADLRAAFAELDHCKIQLDEARTIAETLYAFECRGADWPNTLEEFNPDLDHALLPKWLSGEPAAPERWEQPHAAQRALDEEGIDATREYDPDYGKDLDYDDEDEEHGDAGVQRDLDDDDVEFDGEIDYDDEDGHR